MNACNKNLHVALMGTVANPVYMHIPHTCNYRVFRPVPDDIRPLLERSTGVQDFKDLLL